jgi:hypothetical protein
VSDRGPSKRSVKWGISAAIGVIILVTCVVLLFKLVLFKHVWPNSASTHEAPAASVVIGTFITLYGLFIGGFGGLAGFVAKRGAAKGCLEIRRVMAVTFLIAGTLLDLLRVLDSAGDLFTAATSGLSYRALNDIVHDFQIYFAINVFVAAFSIWVACQLAEIRSRAAQTYSNSPPRH